MQNHKSINVNIKSLYEEPLPASRTGPLYNAFSYPTKISPEVIAVFIATHTKTGATILDAFSGSGTTGIATLLCDRPTPAMKRMANNLGVMPEWGPRKAHLFDIGVLGSFVAQTLCNPPSPEVFAKAASELIAQAQSQLGWMYKARDSEGNDGFLRHAIWSDVLICSHCQTEISYWDATVRHYPLQIVDAFDCPSCHAKCSVNACKRAIESFIDPLTHDKSERKKRVLVQVYGKTGSRTWRREPTEDDRELNDSIKDIPLPLSAPIRHIVWGDLHRAGYHKGITHLHHFYTSRNFLAVATLWDLANAFPENVRDALKLLVLSYNSSHSTLMTRVVVKNGQGDFVITGSQSGVLYISGLPIEKNVFEGVSRKIKTLKQSFALIHGSAGKVKVHNRSSEDINLPNSSIDYVFTDPPFGDYIPYAEINQINELWLGTTTDRSKEIIVSDAQGRSVAEYSNMIGKVFKEISRLLKPNGLATIVFHSARSEIWRALTQSYSGAGLVVRASTILDKLQASFKQTVSEGSVKGDPLLLLSKGNAIESSENIESVVREIFSELSLADKATADPKRLYSRFISRCLELGIDVEIGAKEFYVRAKKLLETTP
ncbi:MAG: DNA methylase [Anaerolineaceae bacterium]|nr:DNA methylase [Anaerolineaceae bacterium]